MNKLLKTVIAGISALTMCISVMPLSANAATQYQKGDVNGDGIVNSSDVLALNNFLHGKVSSQDGVMAERLDVNQDCVINQNDLTILKNINLGLNEEKLIPSKSTESLPKQESRKYCVFDLKGNQIDSYWLYKNDVPAISTSSTRYIIGKNDRKVQNGFKGVVKLTSSAGTGTGFIVDDHTILTAGHCLYDEDNHKGVSNLQIHFYDDYNDEDTSISATPISCHIPYEYVRNYDNDTTNDDSLYVNYDYGLITVEQDLSQYINFDLGVLRTDVITQNPNIKFYAMGFGGKDSKKETFGTRYSCEGTLTTSSPITPYLVYFNNDCVGGDSGGPVYIDSNGFKTAIALFTYQDGLDPTKSRYNLGTRITTDILQFLYNNENL